MDALKFLYKVKSLPKTGNIKTTKIRQRESLTELVAEKWDPKEFDLFSHFKASEFLMVKDTYYEDLYTSLLAILNPKN